MTAENDAPALTEYVAGFAFDTDGRVALIRKNRPEWQAGRLNGIGGHVEPGEHPNDAMWREFHEETGVALSGWQKYAVMDFPGARIHFFRLRNLATTELDMLRSMTDEEVCLVWPGDANYHLMIPNLSWLIPLAAYTADEYDPIHVRARVAESVLPPGDRHTCRHCGGPLGDAFDSDDHTCRTRVTPPAEKGQADA